MIVELLARRDGDVFRHASWAALSISTDKTRPALCLLHSIDNRLVATDGRAMHYTHEFDGCLAPGAYRVLRHDGSRMWLDLQTESGSGVLPIGTKLPGNWRQNVVPDVTDPTTLSHRFEYRIAAIILRPPGDGLGLAAAMLVALILRESGIMLNAGFVRRAITTADPVGHVFYTPDGDSRVTNKSDCVAIVHRLGMAIIMPLVPSVARNILVERD
jgi:hypothetical protein